MAVGQAVIPEMVEMVVILEVADRAAAAAAAVAEIVVVGWEMEVAVEWAF